MRRQTRALAGAVVLAAARAGSASRCDYPPRHRTTADDQIVATPSATLPVAGTVRNTNRLLGHDGFVGVKTGSTAAAGGCFAFRAIRWIDGMRMTITASCWASPATTGSRLVSRPPTSWSTASPVIGLCQIYRNEPRHQELCPDCTLGSEPVSMQSPHARRTHD